MRGVLRENTRFSHPYGKKIFCIDDETTFESLTELLPVDARGMAKGFRSSGFRMNKWIAEQDAWGVEQLEERCERLVKQFLELWSTPQSSYVPQVALPDKASLDSDADFMGRRISAFTFMGERHVVKQWNTMEQMVVRRVYEQDPAKVCALVEGTEYPANYFRANAVPEYSKVADGVFVRTGFNNEAKMNLLRELFAICGIDESELTFEMPIEEAGESDTTPMSVHAETQQVKLAYWTKYQEVAAEHPEFLEVFSPHKPSKNHSSDLKLDGRGYRIALLIETLHGRTGLEFYVDNDKSIGRFAIENKRLFEDALGLKAIPFDAKKSSGVRFYKDGHPIKGNEAAWPANIEEQLDWALKMKKVLEQLGL